MPTAGLLILPGYQAEVIVENNALAFRDNTITGLWDMERYITLLMGEIPASAMILKDMALKGKTLSPMWTSLNMWKKLMLI